MLLLMAPSLCTSVSWAACVAMAGRGCSVWETCCWGSCQLPKGQPTTSGSPAVPQSSTAKVCSKLFLPKEGSLVGVGTERPVSSSSTSLGTQGWQRGTVTDPGFAAHRSVAWGKFARDPPSWIRGMQNCIAPLGNQERSAGCGDRTSITPPSMFTCSA